MHSVLVEQVIVEKVPKSAIPDIDKKKFLVPADLSGKYEITKLLYNSTQLFNVFFPFFSVRPPPVAQFMYIVRRRISLPSEKAMFLFVNKVLPTTRSVSNPQNANKCTPQNNNYTHTCTCTVQHYFLN